jgi:hypothetical protein
MSLRSIELRLAAVERMLTPTRAAPQVVIVHGGIRGQELSFATAGGHRWDRLPDESLPTFRSRVIALATRAREPWVIVRGLP